MGQSIATDEINSLLNLVLSILVDLANVQTAIAGTLSQDDRLGPEFRKYASENKNETLARAYSRMITRIDDNAETQGSSQLLKQLRAHLEQQRQSLMT